MALPGFRLVDAHSKEHSFPSDKYTLLVFMKEDCPTCHLSMPLVENAFQIFGSKINVLAIGQEDKGNKALIKQYDLSVPVLDDSALSTSFSYDLDTVPTVILADKSGEEMRRFVGFGRDDWRALYAHLAELSTILPPEINWDDYPESRPGCGSLSVEPGIAEKLEAESSGSPLRARPMEIGSGDDIHEFFYDQGLTDGLPVIPPTAERVLKMLSGISRNAQEIVITAPPNLTPVTVEKVAINAVMAGCRPEYMPVVISMLEACVSDEFNAHGVWATTMGASPGLVLNGPIRHEVKMNMKLGALGQGHRANATIGRAVRLVMRNLGGAKPSGTERSTLGNAMKYTHGFAEWEERSPWEPLHVEYGYDEDDSVLSIFPLTSGPYVVVDQTSRSARQLAGSFGLTLCGIGNQNMPTGHVLLVVCPEHADTLARDGWSKRDLREYMIEVTTKPTKDWMSTSDYGGLELSMFGPDGPTDEQMDKPLSKFSSVEHIHVAVAGSEAGKFSAAFGGWASRPVHQLIDDNI